MGDTRKGNLGTQRPDPSDLHKGASHGSRIPLSPGWRTIPSNWKEYEAVSRSDVLRRVRQSGYVVVNGVIEHRQVWKRHYGKIPPGWVVHHIDFDKKNNGIENLIALPEYFHHKIHRDMKAGDFKLSRKDLWPHYEAFKAQYEALMEERKFLHARLQVLTEKLGRLGVDTDRIKPIKAKKIKKKKFKNVCRPVPQKTGRKEAFAREAEKLRKETKVVSKPLTVLRKADTPEPSDFASRWMEARS